MCSVLRLSTSYCKRQERERYRASASAGVTANPPLPTGMGTFADTRALRLTSIALPSRSSEAGEARRAVRVQERDRLGYELPSAASLARYSTSTTYTSHQ